MREMIQSIPEPEENIANLDLVVHFSGTRTADEFVIVNQKIGSYVSGPKFHKVVSGDDKWQVYYNGTPSNPGKIMLMRESGTVIVIR